MTSNEFQILLIDDDEDEFVNIRDLFSEAKGIRYRVVWMSSYKTGLKALQEGTYDACLLDYRLGEQTGLDLLKAASRFGTTCPIIFLTGQGDFDLDVQAMQVGAADYLVKDQLTAPLLERTVRYAMKHALDLQQLKENRAQILQHDRLASLGLLASSLAHEIGTPMGIIRSRAELLERKLADQQPLKDSIGVIILQIDKITKLVNSLLHLARGKNSDHTTAVNVGQVIDDVLNLVQHELDRKDIAFIKEMKGTPLVKAESGSLGQVLLNLFVNAIHAIEDAKQKGRTEKHQINLRVEENTHSVKIFVQDSGLGIPEENLSQLFKPFFTTKEIGVGTGLGLATSFSIVTNWGGTLSAKNHPDRGAIFEISLLKSTKP